MATSKQNHGDARAGGDAGEDAFVPETALATADVGTRLSLLSTSPTGLSLPEAERRLRTFGANEPVRPRRSHPALAFISQFTHTLALLLWFAAGLAFAAGITELGAAILAVVLINGAFAFVQEYRAEQVVASLTRRVATQATAVRDGKVLTLPAIELVPGDIVRLSVGDIVPADCTLIAAESLDLDLSLLTGESIPVERTSEPVVLPAATPAISEIGNLLPAGAGVVTGSGVAAVWRTGEASTVGTVAGLVAGVRRERSILERQVASLSRVTATIAVLAGASTLLLATAVTDTEFLTGLTFATGVLVALVPEGLLPTLSVSLAVGARRMADRGAAARRLSAVEVVGAVTVICTDKTGTLTENRLTVESAIPVAEGVDVRELCRAGVLCNDAQLTGGGAYAGDPIDVALMTWASDHGIDAAAERAAHPRTGQVPFHALRRYMSVTCKSDDGERTYFKGAPEALLQLTADHQLRPEAQALMDLAMDQGQRAIMVAGAVGDGTPVALGLLLLGDPPRSGVPEAIEACRRAGIRVVMLTGDHPQTARSIATAIGLADARTPVMKGTDIDGMVDSELRAALGQNAIVARVDPAQKLRIVRALQAGREIVVVTGDGVNDAPALRAADVGVAMGLRGTEVAKQAADVVLADDNFATIVTAIEEGRAMRANIRRFVSYVFTSNVAEMAPFLLYIFLPVPLPLAVIQALAIDIGTDLLPALALGAESPSRGTMSVPPEPPSRPILTRALGLRTFLFFGVIEAALGLAAFFAFYWDAGWRPGDSFDPFDALTREASTVTFLAIVGGQVACLAAQRDGPLRRRLSLRGNRWVMLGLTFELAVALLLVYTPGLNRAFSMAPVDPDWLLVLPAAALIFLALDEARRRSSLRMPHA